MELETHLLLASRLGFVSTTEVEQLLEKTGEVSRMLSGLTRNLKHSRTASART
jgi:four helix bundle protein